jgi:hypothetical protein
MEHGTWNIAPEDIKHKTWSMEHRHGAWNMEHGTWNIDMKPKAYKA